MIKKFLFLLAGCFLFAGQGQGATITVSNYNLTGDGNYGIADESFTRLTAVDGKGILGRMDGLTAGEVKNHADAGNIAALDAAFQPFGGEEGAFFLDSAGDAGAFEATVIHDTRASVRPGYGGSPIYAWFYKGESRATAGEYLLIRLNQNFPTDPEDVPHPAVEIAVAPGGVAAFVAGDFGLPDAVHDYGNGSGPLGLYTMVSTSTSINIAPVAHNGEFAVFAGIAKQGQLSASDINANDVLTFLVVDEPQKGTVDIQADGSFTYTAFVDELGQDTFTFRVTDSGDGQLESEVATMTITISPPPPNTAPVAQSVVVAVEVVTGQSVGGTLVASDEDEEDVLTFSVVAQPTKGQVDVNAETGAYTYTATLGQLGADSFTFKANDGTDDSNVATVSINILPLPEPEAPSIVITQLDSGYVGTFYEFQIPVANLPQGAATAYTAKGLPGGLKLNTKTGLISGFPTVAATDKVVTLTAKNAVGASGNVDVTITINAVPPGVVGVFLARVERNDHIGGGMGGSLSLTTTGKGTFSAKLMSGTVAYTGKGNLEIVDSVEPEADPSVTVTINFVRKGSPTLVANLVLDTSFPAANPLQIAGDLTNPENKTADVSGVRNTWTKTSKPTTYLGDYTYGMTIPDGLEGVPQGDGFGTLNVSDKGVAKFVGKTADGKVFTISSILGPQGDMPFYIPLVVNAGSLVGLPMINVNGTPYSLTGLISRSKPDETPNTKSKERAYRAGFATFNLTMAGGKYQVPDAGGVVGGLPDYDLDPKPNVSISFEGGGLADGDIEPFEFTIMNKKATGITQTVIVPKFNAKLTPNPNPNTIAFKLLPKPAGHFSGTFNVLNPDKKLLRKVTYQGTFVRKSDGTFDRLGILLAELPDDIPVGEKVTTSPLHSGWLQIDDVTYPAPAPVQP